MTTATRRAQRSDPYPAITRSHRNLLTITALLTTVLVALGGIVCATDSSSACPDWPGCFGRVVPPANINALIEYTHRAFAAFTGVLIIVSAWISLRRTPSIRAIAWSSAGAVLFTIAVVFFGRAVVLTGLPRPLAALDLASALLVLTLMITAAVVARMRHAAPSQAVPTAKDASRSPLAPLGLAASISLYAVHIGGVLTSGHGSLTRCVGWPMLAIVPTDGAAWPQVVRLVLAAFTAALIVAVAIGARRSHPRTAVLLPLLLIIELVLGLLIFTRGSTLPLVMAYVTIATVLFAVLVTLTVLSVPGSNYPPGKRVPG
jgi:heme a synthase